MKSPTVEKKKLILNKKTILDLQSLSAGTGRLPSPPSTPSPCYSCDLSCKTSSSCCVPC